MLVDTSQMYSCGIHTFLFPDHQQLRAIIHLEDKLNKMEEKQNQILKTVQRIEANIAPPTCTNKFPQQETPVQAVEHENIDPHSESSTSKQQQQQHTYSSEPLPLQHIYLNSSLPSEEIDKNSLLDIEEAVKLASELKTVEKAGTFTQKLAKEAIFGTSVMKRCTPGGTKELRALPKREMMTLKKTVYRQLPQMWHSVDGFEKLWKGKCWPAVEQACRRLRRRNQ